jgi:hypothetical protein
MSDMLRFKVELEIDTSADVFGRSGGMLHDLYLTWVEGGKDDGDWERLSECIEDEIDIADLQFWVEDVKLIG